MIRNRPTILTHAFLALAFAAFAGPGIAADVTTETAKDDIARQLKEMKASIDALTNIQKAQTDIEELKRQVTQIRQDLDELRRTMTTTRSAGYVAPQTTSTGRVRLVNTYMEPMTVVVNGKSYPIAPGEQRYTDALPAGTFSYEVLGVQSLRDRMLAANETFTINIYPR